MSSYDNNTYRKEKRVTIPSHLQDIPATTSLHTEENRVRFLQGPAPVDLVSNVRGEEERKKKFKVDNHDFYFVFFIYFFTSIANPPTLPPSYPNNLVGRATGNSRIE